MDDRSSPDEALQFDNTFSDAAATAPRRRPAEQTGFGSGVAASAPRHNDSGQLGSRRTPGTTSRADQPGFDSGVAASAPRHNDGDQTGSRRTPGTTSSSSTRSSKRQRGEPAQCPPIRSHQRKHKCHLVKSCLGAINSRGIVRSSIGRGKTISNPGQSKDGIKVYHRTLCGNSFGNLAAHGEIVSRLWFRFRCIVHRKE